MDTFSDNTLSHLLRQAEGTEVTSIPTLNKPTFDWSLAILAVKLWMRWRESPAARESNGWYGRERESINWKPFRQRIFYVSFLQSPKYFPTSAVCAYYGNKKGHLCGCGFEDSISVGCIVPSSQRMTNLFVAHHLQWQITLFFVSKCWSELLYKSCHSPYAPQND